MIIVKQCYLNCRNTPQLEADVQKKLSCFSFHKDYFFYMQSADINFIDN